MIPLRYFPLISRAAKIMLRRNDTEGERWMVDLLGRLRNTAINPDVPEGERAKAREQHTELTAMLERHRKLRQADDGGPTPEAKAKARKRGEAIGNLHALGTLSRQQVDAAEHIEAGYRLAVGDVSKVGQFRYAPPLDRGEPGDWTDGQVRCWQRYLRWWERCGEADLPMDAIMALIVEPVTVKEIETRHGMRRGTLTPQLSEALSIYCVIIGFSRAA